MQSINNISHGTSHGMHDLYHKLPYYASQYSHYIYYEIVHEAQKVKYKM